MGTKRRIAIITMSIGVFFISIFSNTYPTIPINEVITIIISISFVLALGINWVLNKWNSKEK